MYQPTAKGVNLNVLIYGEPGVGKTTLAATAQDHPLMKDVLFLNIEGGLLSVVSRGEPIAAVDIRSAEAVEEVFWELRKVMTDPEGDSPLKSIKTVVIDSGSELQTIVLENLARQGVEKAKGMGKQRSPDDIFLEDYGKATASLSRIFRWFRDLPVNFILTALPNPIFPKGVENADPIAIQPLFTAKLASKVMGYMDMVWYLYLDENGERCMLTRSSGLYKCKTRGAQFATQLPMVVKKQKDGTSALTLPLLYDLLQSSETPPIVTATKKEQKTA